MENLSTIDIEKFIAKAVKLSLKGMNKDKGGPFGAVIVKDGKIVGKGYNRVTSKNDPTLHAEVVAIRDACKTLKTFELSGCILFTSCEPCPMCLGAVYWARLDKVYYANTRKDAAEIGFDDEFFYEEIKMAPAARSVPCIKTPHEGALKVFGAWMGKKDKVGY